MSPNGSGGQECNGEPAYRDEETLRRLYVDEQLSARDIAEQFDCSRQTVRRWMQKHDIPFRDPGETTGLAGKNVDEYPYRDEETLRRLYVDEGLTAPEVAERLDCREKTVYRWLDNFGIETRQTATGRNPEVAPTLDDPEALRGLYTEQQLTVYEIADKLDCGSTTVERRLDGHSIPKRPRGWRYGWEDDYGANWDTQREKRLEMDGRECVVCGMSMDEHEEQFGRALNVHHIIRKEAFRSNDGVLDYERANRVENLVTLCDEHHLEWEGIPLRPMTE